MYRCQKRTIVNELDILTRGVLRRLSHDGRTESQNGKASGEHVVSEHYVVEGEERLATRRVWRTVLLVYCLDPLMQNR